MSVTDFQNVLRLQRVITLRHSTGFQCILVHKQTTLPSTSCSQKRYDLVGRRQANLCFHFAGSGENLPDIAKSRDTTQDNKLFGSQLMKQNCFLFQGTSCHFFSQSLGTDCTRFHLLGLMSSSSIILVQHCSLLLYTTDCHCRKKNGHFV